MSAHRPLGSDVWEQMYGFMGSFSVNVVSVSAPRCVCEERVREKGAGALFIEQILFKDRFREASCRPQPRSLSITEH